MSYCQTIPASSSTWAIKNVSEAWSLVGTSAYLPPEIAQADGHTPYDPFEGDVVSELLYVISCGEYPSVAMAPMGSHAT